MQPIGIRAACAAAAATSVAIIALVGATSSNLASAGESPMRVALQSDQGTPLAKMKADYRRPATIPFPKDNPYSVEKASLGKKLFFDTRLSAANILSCGSCHSPAYGWGDGQPTGVGHGMKKLGRRSPTIVNAAFGQIFMWDGRAGSLEEQALGPIRADVEMNLPVDQLIEKLKGIDGYRPLFQAVFPAQGIAPETIAKAIATYERTVVSNRAPFDAWIEGDEAAISQDAVRGFVLFNTKARCVDCHSGWNFTDDSFHDIGLASTDIGRAKIVPGIEKMKFAFKTPGLREISLRGPYMHDGSVPTLQAVMDHYNRGGIDRPSRSAQIKPLSLSKQESADLVAFMKTLNSDLAPTSLPCCRVNRYPANKGLTTMKPFTLVLLLAFAAGSATAYAAQVSISQKGKVFSQTELAVKKGDVITFVNDDAVTHNVMSTSSGNTFNLGAQAPGVSLPFTFNNAGEMVITCAIHPTMKLKVTVAN